MNINDISHQSTNPPIHHGAAAEQRIILYLINDIPDLL